MKRWLRLLVVLLIIVSAGVLVYFNQNKDKEVEAAWYGTNWQYRKALVIDSDKVSGSTDLTNFPVLVSRIDVDLKDNAQADADDILFTSSDGETKLDHEIESYDSTTGNLIAWVRIPTLRYNTDTRIYMYYGNSSASNQQNSTGVWSNGYEAVYHFNNSLNNSTSASGRDGTNTGTTNTSNGKIGDAREFDASSVQYINIGTWNVSGDEITMQAWVNFASFITNNFQRLISKGIGNDATSS
jgi:hypothetical protein